MAKGFLNRAWATPTVSASPDYTSGDAIGGIMTFSDVMRAAGASGYVTQASIDCAAQISVQVDLLIFNASPSSSTVTDNSTFVLHDNDRQKLIGVVPVSTWYSTDSTPGVRGEGDLSKACAVVSAPSANLYGVLVARDAVNLAATDDVQVRLVVDNN